MRISRSSDGRRWLTLVPGEVPLLELRFLATKVLGGVHGLGLGTILVDFRDGEFEVLIRRPSNGLGPIQWSMHLETDVEVLSSKKVGSAAVSSI